MPNATTFLDEIGIPLSRATFIVVDLETTGTSALKNRVTEIGAVAVRGGQILSEFETFVDPGEPIPASITALTGITTSMVYGAPSEDVALRSLLDWARILAVDPQKTHGTHGKKPDVKVTGLDPVWVAHNARFDLGFLKRIAAENHVQFPAWQVVDTVKLARRALTRDEVPNNKLDTLATFFRSPVLTRHRALEDARATADVLHGLFERMASMGVTHVSDLASAADPVPAARRARSHLADRLSAGPGCYQFISHAGQTLYVGTAMNVRRRVRSYFTAAENRRRIGEMVDLSARVSEVRCVSALEAAVMEMRLIEELDPPYNRRSKRQSQRPWIMLTDRPHTRLQVKRRIKTEQMDHALGPFPSQKAAGRAIEAMETIYPLTTSAISYPQRIPTQALNAEAEAEIRKILTGHTREFFTLALGQLRELAEKEQFELAASYRDRLLAVFQAACRRETLLSLAANPEIIAAAPTDNNGWEIAVIRYGRLAAIGIAEGAIDPLALAEALKDDAERVPCPEIALGATPAEETEILGKWVFAPGTRLIEVADSPIALASSIDSARAFSEVFRPETED